MTNTNTNTDRDTGNGTQNQHAPNINAFTHDTPADEIGGRRNDAERVKNCLADAVAFYHDNLPGNLREYITEKWGISNDMINARQIGFVDDTNDAVTHLRNNGYDNTTILRAGIASAHVLTYLVNDTDAATTYPDPIPELQARIADNDIEPAAINIEAVLEYLHEHDGYTRTVLRDWWENRIIFPYRNDDGEYCYLIARATNRTADQIYNNGITDATDAPTRITNTPLRHDLPSKNTDAEYIIDPAFKHVYNDPYNDDHANAIGYAVETLAAEFNTGEIDAEALQRIGITPLRDSGAATPHVTINNTRHAHPTFHRETVTGSEESLLGTHCETQTVGEYVVSPAATGVNPGDDVTLQNNTDRDVTVTVQFTPEGVWWDDTELAAGDELTVTCSERGMYKYTIEIPTRTGTDTHHDDSTGNENGNGGNDGNDDAGISLRGVLLAYDEIFTERRNTYVEEWLDWEPSPPDQIPKYVKQTINREWVNHDAVKEPIFGCETVHEGKPLIVTEGVTDAIIAHQYNFPCVAPATTNFKRHHYEKITVLAEDASHVYVVNDNETNNAGINGALRTAKVIENAGIEARVGVLPLPDDERKIDVAEFFKHNDRSDFIDVLQDAVKPAEHDLYDAERHDPQHNRNTGAGGGGEDDSSDGDSQSHEYGDDGEFTGENVSAIYSLDLRDVIPLNELDCNTASSGVIYRGVNPIQHHGNSKGYFVIRDHGEFITAKDYKIESRTDGYYYNALTWLACAARDRSDSTGNGDGDGDSDGFQTGCTRDVTRPMGSLSNCEVFWAWYHAKHASSIPVPSDDPIPKKAMWYIAGEEAVLPEDVIPEEHDDEFRLPASKYNEVLQIVANEYGTNPGRDEIPVN